MPVIRDADQKDVYALASELADLSGRAREGKLKIDEMATNGGFMRQSMKVNGIVLVLFLMIAGCSKSESPGQSLEQSENVVYPEVVAYVDWLEDDDEF